MEYFQRQTGLSLTLPGFKENVQLVGASVSKINNIKVPLVFYKLDGVPTIYKKLKIEKFIRNKPLT
ncbi:MAG: hypothetical protein E3K36_07595 [Candidatus Brocadia sp.]|nr:hypothetical protein [Candidatus Brocadia sp.]